MARRLVNPTTPASQLSQSVQARIGLDELHDEWRRLYKSEPPKISRDLLAMELPTVVRKSSTVASAKATLRKLQTLVCTENSNPHVGVMKSAQKPARKDTSIALNRPR